MPDSNSAKKFPPVLPSRSTATAEVTAPNSPDSTTLMELPAPPPAAPVQPARAPVVPSTETTNVGVPVASQPRTGFYLGGKRFVVVKLVRGKPVIGIREYFQPQDKAPGRLFAGKKGPSTLSEWNALCGHVEGIQHSLEDITKH